MINISGVFARFYYPSIHPLNETINKSELWPIWADDDYLIGFVKFMQAVLAKWPSWAPRGEFMYIDQISYIAPMMHLGCTHVWKFLNGKVHIPILKNAPISTEKKWPVIVFSHGMGCNRFAYSRICTDLASHGFVVAATEHRDGSGSLSFTMEGGVKNWIPHRRISDTEKEYTVRNQQLHSRVEEVKRTMDLVLTLNNGGQCDNVLEEAKDFDLSMFKNTMEVTAPILAGHSYGGKFLCFPNTWYMMCFQLKFNFLHVLFRCHDPDDISQGPEVPTGSCTRWLAFPSQG